MKNIISKMCLAIAFCLVMTQIGYSDYAYSVVQVGVATSKSFSVTLNGQGVVNSNPAFPGTATAVLWFNSTDGNTKQVNATVIGASDQVGPYPLCTTPILVFKNTGTVNETLSIKNNNTITGMVFFYNASMATGDSGGLANTTVGAAFNSVDSPMVTRLYPGNSTNVCIWANFSTVGGGNYQTQFNYTSS